MRATTRRTVPEWRVIIVLYTRKAASKRTEQCQRLPKVQQKGMFWHVSHNQ